MGRFVLGVELEYIKRYSFSGVGAAPSTDDEVAFTSLRYYFQSRRTPSHTIIPNDPVCSAVRWREMGVNLQIRRKRLRHTRDW
jgi:hypothetical protein